MDSVDKYDVVIDEYYDLLDLIEEEMYEDELSYIDELCEFFVRNKDKPLYDLVEGELSYIPLSEVCALVGD
ncbi:MAG: hypothetical protein QXR31_04480 [Zestosphaera sp.]